jgi:hypothetical protein
MEREVGDRIDWDRVHFLGRVPYASYRSILQISRCHVYLTVPFVLSWSLLEAMSMGATDRRLRRRPGARGDGARQDRALGGFLRPRRRWPGRWPTCSPTPRPHRDLGQNARDHVVETYDFHTRALPTMWRRSTISSRPPRSPA